MTDITETRADIIRREAREHLESIGPLPSVDELAEPFVRGFLQLHRLHERAESLRSMFVWADIDGVPNDFTDRLQEFMRLIDRVAVLARIGAGNCLAGEHQGAEFALDLLIRSASGAVELDNEVHQDHVQRLQYGDEAMEAGE